MLDKIRSTNIMTPTESYVVRYPGFVDLAEKQSNKFWFPDEYDVERDKHDLLVEMTESEKYGVSCCLKLFTLYELHIGNNYWANYVIPNFPRPEITRMASAFCHVENNSHAPFYDKINQVLGLSTDEFYHSYKENELLSNRVKSIGKFISHENPLVSTAVFSMIEGVVLYSNFAYLKSFSSQGHSLAKVIGSGINASVIDENFHSLGGAGLYNQTKKEAGLTAEELNSVEKMVREAATLIVSHEDLIIDMFFEKGPMRSCTPHQLKVFVRSRVNECLHNLDIEPMYSNLKGNTIQDWFYSGINNYQYGDFFSVTGREYVRSWDLNKLKWESNLVNQ